MHDKNLKSVKVREFRVRANGEAPYAPPRRRFIGLMGAAGIAAVAARGRALFLRQAIVAVDGWILADTDLR
jgi:hypothetical protein